MEYSISVDDMKTISEICEPDPRNTAFAVYDEANGTFKPKTLQDHYSQIANIRLHEKVPKDVYTHFETARNLFLYTWFVYRFSQVAELHAYASVEYALKKRIDSKKLLDKLRGFKALLNYAIEQDWIKDDGFRQYNRIERIRKEHLQSLKEVLGEDLKTNDTERIQSYRKILSDVLPRLRNDLAHGSSMLNPNIYLTFEVCCDLINQLF